MTNPINRVGQLYELQNGWKKKIIPRRNGKSAGKWDVYLYTPLGTKIRSTKELIKHLRATKLQIDPFVINMDKSCVANIAPSKSVTQLIDTLRGMSNGAQSTKNNKIELIPIKKGEYEDIISSESESESDEEDTYAAFIQEKKEKLKVLKENAVLRKENEELYSSAQKIICKICLDQDVRVALVPCFHVFCEQCAERMSRGDAEKLSRCGLCKKEITNKQTVFMC